MIWIITLINVLLYLTFIIVDIIFKNTYPVNSSYLKYTTIILCSLLTLFINNHGYTKRDTSLLQIAFFFTGMADFFFLFLNWNTLGVCAFILVQITYIVRHKQTYRVFKQNLLKISIFYILFFLISFLFKPTNIQNSLYFISIIYGGLLIISFIIAINTINKHLYPKETSTMIALGMFLFVICDLNVGLFNILNHGPFEFLIWIFYFPSQLLLALSGYNIHYLKEIFFKQ